MVAVTSLVVLVSYVAFTYGIERRQLDAAASMKECYDTIYRYSCESSTLAQDGANLALGCGSEYVPIAENYASQCARGPGGEYCLNLVLNLDISRAKECVSANDSSFCTSDCRSFLQSVVDTMGCCVMTIFNERLSPLLLGHDIRVSLMACDIAAEPACTSTVDLEGPTNTQTCTVGELWGGIAGIFCRVDEAQPYINALLKTPGCAPLARHHAVTCGRGVNNTYCLQLFETSFNPTNPTRTLFIHPQLNNAITQCANYSSFQSEGCPSACKSALEVAIEAVGCCINLFNDTISGVVTPYFTAEVTTACGVASPGFCETDLNFIIRDGAVINKSFISWVYIMICFALSLWVH